MNSFVVFKQKKLHIRRHFGELVTVVAAID